MPPLDLLAILLGLTAVAVWREYRARHRLRTVLRAMAAGARMNFSVADQFRLTSRVVAIFPVPGAASVVVHDLLYSSEGGRHRYLFTVDYTLGVVRTKRRLRRVAAFSEPRDRTALADPPPTLQLAPGELSLVDQYLALLPAGPVPR